MHANYKKGEPVFVYTEEPWGSCPTQAEGIIVETGQAFYFRYRVGKASLAVSCDAHPVYLRDDRGLAHFREENLLATEPDRWSMSAQRVTDLVSAWVAQYLQSKRTV